MALLDDLLTQIPPELLGQINSTGTMGPDGRIYIPHYTGGNSSDTMSITGYDAFDPSLTPGAQYQTFDASGKSTGTQTIGPGDDISWAQGLMAVLGTAAAGIGVSQMLGGTAGAGAGAGAAEDLGGPITMAGAVGPAAGAAIGGGAAGGVSSLLSSLGSSLLGGSTLAKILPLISGIVGGTQASKSASTANDLAKELIDRSDPFYQYRAGYGQKLAALEASHDVTSIPGYQAGLEAVQRAGAAQGFTGSGNMMKALQDYGGNFYNDELKRLATLAGAGTAPGAGFQQGAQLIGQGQATGAFGTQQIINGIASLFGGAGSSSALSSLGSSPGLTGNPIQVSDTPQLAGQDMNMFA